jgi:hypothetical protein
MKKNPAILDLSVVLAVGNCEETAGRQVRTLAQHLRSLGRSFEIVAVNDGSRDNTLAVLNLLESEVPELRLVCRDALGRAFLRGAAEARGQTVVLASVSATAGASTWSILGWALGRVESGKDAVVLRGRFTVARRLPCLPAIARAKGPTPSFERRFEREISALAVDVVGTRRPVVKLSNIADLLLTPLRLLSTGLPRF